MQYIGRMFPLVEVLGDVHGTYSGDCCHGSIKPYDLHSRNRMKTNAVMHQYFEATTSPYPTSRLIDLNIAIDSLMGLLVGTDEPILSKGEFRKVRAWLSTAIKYVAHLTKMSDATRRRLEDNLQALNRRSVGERHRAFWTGLGIERTRLEIDALLTRQPSVHEGHVGDEHAEGVLRRNYELSCVLANLFNRAFLTALGWEGKYLDALPSDRRVERPLSEGQSVLPSEKT